MVRKQRVRVPLRLVVSPFYPDVALSAYVKVAALAARPEACEAKTVTLAVYLGMSTASVERGLAALSRPAPDGVVELAAVRRTLPGGRGTSAVRRVRPVSPGEGFVWLPVAAAEDLTPRQLRAYAVIAYAEKMRIALTEAELASYLRHYAGKRAGLPITADAAGTVVDEVEAARWITVERRAGAYGRHRFIAHDIAPEGRPAVAAGVQGEACAEVPEAGVTTVYNRLPEAASSCVGEGTGGAVDEGSLAYKESPTTDSPDDERAAWSPAVGEAQVGKGRQAVENPGAGAAATKPAGAGGRGLALRAGDHSKPSPTTANSEKRTRSGGLPRSAYAGPQLQLSPLVFAVLEPVSGLYQQANVFMKRRIAREVSDQLNTGTDPERLRHRLERRYTRVVSEDVRDAGSWLLGVALPRWGCGHQDCEAGRMWSTGKTCDVCADVCADRAAQREIGRRRSLGLCPQHGTRPGRDGSCVDCELGDVIRNPPPAPAPAVRPAGVPVGNCGDCGARTQLVGQGLADGLCRGCRELAVGPATALAKEDQVLCAGAPGDPCGRLALPTRAVCLRHRSQELAAESG
jgi:hypothetical protein